MIGENDNRLWSVPRLWPDSTVVCIGGGPSLTQQQVDYCRDKARVIAVNDAYRPAPWADLLYGCDAQWWKWHDGVPGFGGVKVGLRYKLDPKDGQIKCQGDWTDELYPDVKSLAYREEWGGLEADPRYLRTGTEGGGSSSGYQAINLAVHLGASTIILLGYDMKPGPDGKSHWFGEHPNQVPLPLESMSTPFDTLVGPLTQVGVEVLNCAPDSAITVFPMARLEEVLGG